MELSVSQRLIFKGQIDKYIQQEAMLQENMQRAYSCPWAMYQIAQGKTEAVQWMVCWDSPD
jgi:hypothetical protein